MYLENLFIQRCLELALHGMGHVAPNPLVGCVIVHENKIIGEGFHKQFGQAHAEVNAIASVADKNLLSNSTLYVNLEPCSHHGKTPPCSELIIKHKIPHVVIGCTDTFSQVNGKGIAALKSAGIKVTFSILEAACRNLNKRFFTFHDKKRPYVILKWAQSKDGFIGKNKLTPPLSISGDAAKILSHKWRSEEAAIMVGTNTALIDNPQLNTRLWKGKNPIRIVIDQRLKIPTGYHLLSGKQHTLIFNAIKNETIGMTEYILIDFNDNIILSILEHLYQKHINSILIEGGSHLLSQFIDQNLWDETRIFSNEKYLNDGVKAPVFNFNAHATEDILTDRLNIFYRF